VLAPVEVLLHRAAIVERIYWKYAYASFAVVLLILTAILPPPPETVVISSPFSLSLVVFLLSVYQISFVYFCQAHNMGWSHINDKKKQSILPIGNYSCLKPRREKRIKEDNRENLQCHFHFRGWLKLAHFCRGGGATYR
jgi:hypothetical protein